MGTRSLFNLSSGGAGGGYGGRGIGALLGQMFQPEISINPEYDEATNPDELYTGKGGLFGKGRRDASNANAEIKGKKVLAKYGADLAFGNTQKESKLKRANEQEDLGDEGMAIGQNLGALPFEQAQKIFPAGQTFSSPQEQALAYKQKFGANTAMAEAPKKPYMSLGNGYVNPGDLSFIEAGQMGHKQTITNERVATGEMTLEKQPDGTFKSVPQYKEVPKVINEEVYHPANMGQLRPMATQEALNAIPKSPSQTQPPIVSAKPNGPYPEQGFMSPDNNMMGTNYNPRSNLSSGVPIPSTNVPTQPQVPNFNSRISAMNNEPATDFNGMLNQLMPQTQGQAPEGLPGAPMINQTPLGPPAPALPQQPVIPPTSPRVSAKPNLPRTTIPGMLQALPGLPRSIYDLIANLDPNSIEGQKKTAPKKNKVLAPK